MARRKRSGNRSGGTMGKARSIFRDAGMGLLGGMVGSLIANKIAPQYATIGTYAGAYLTGNVWGLGAVFLSNSGSASSSSSFI